MSTEMSTGMSTGIEHVEIDFMLLADKAEVLGGKLYMMGGAWDRLTINDITPRWPVYRDWSSRPLELDQ